MKSFMFSIKKAVMIIGSAALAIYFGTYLSHFFTGNLKEGDIVFQTSRSGQSPYIQRATRSRYSHCGIIVMKDGAPYVLEASKTVKLTPFRDWKKKGKHKLCYKRRVVSDCNKIDYSKYLGLPYDLEFKLNNRKYYCSELVWEIYKDQQFIILSKPKRVYQYRIKGMEKLLKERNIDINQLVIAPKDLL